MTFQYASLARGTRSAGVHFDRAKWTKTRQRRGLSPPLESTPPVRGGVCAVRFSALGPVGSHRWLTSPMDGTYFYVSMFFYPQDLTLVCNCSQLPEAWLPAAGTPLLRGRPGYGNHPAIGPVAQVGLVWWQKQGPQQGSRAELRLYPREVLRGERPKRVLVPFDRAKGTPSGERPHQAGKPIPRKRATMQFTCVAHHQPYSTWVHPIHPEYTPSSPPADTATGNTTFPESRW